MGGSPALWFDKQVVRAASNLQGESQRCEEQRVLHGQIWETDGGEGPFWMSKSLSSAWGGFHLLTLRVRAVIPQSRTLSTLHVKSIGKIKSFMDFMGPLVLLLLWGSKLLRTKLFQLAEIGTGLVTERYICIMTFPHGEKAFGKTKCSGF